MSFSSPHRMPDAAGPAPRGSQGVICPKCHRKFNENPPPKVCPDDESLLVRAPEAAAAAPEGATIDPMLGRTLDGRFTIVSRLGAGSMGAVYRARQHAMGREVAIKILRSDRALDDSAKGRFLREARANSLLASPHTVTVFDFGQTASGELFLAMELLEGESLGQRIGRLGRLPADVAVDTVRQALRSLAEAHAKGIIHRDLKPDNLFFAKVVSGGQTEEIVKVLDFGVAKMVGEVNEPLNAVETQAGTVFGTPRYMSPEQAQGKTLDARSDLYSLGVILYHMLTGRPPFTDDDAVVVMARHIKTTPAPPSVACPEAGVPPDLEALLLRVMGKEPAERPLNAEAMIVELANLSEAGFAGSSGVRVSAATGSPFLDRRPSWRVPPMRSDAPSAQTLESELDGRRATPRRSKVTAAIFALAALGAVALAVRAVGDRSPRPPVLAVATAPTPPPTFQPPTPPTNEMIPSVTLEELPRIASPAPSGVVVAPTPRRALRAPKPAAGASTTPVGHSPAATAASVTPAASGSASHYGYLE